MARRGVQGLVVAGANLLPGDRRPRPSGVARGDIQAAVDAYRRATEIIPRPELLAYLGDLLCPRGEDMAAEQQYAAVDFIAELSDVKAEVGMREIVLFQASHDRDTAHAVRLAKAELEVRKDVYGYDALAWALFNDGQVEAALAPALEALSLGTRDARLLYHAGTDRTRGRSRGRGFGAPSRRPRPQPGI